MSKSPNINLELTPAAEGDKTFQAWRTELAGEDSGSNMMILDAEIGRLKADALPISQKGAPGGVASLDAAGKVPSGQLPAMDYDPAGSAAAVRTELGGKADKAVPSAANNVALLDAAGNLKDSGKALTPAALGAASTSHTHTSAQVSYTPKADGSITSINVQGALEQVDTYANEMLSLIVSHQENPTIHVSSSDRIVWNEKVSRVVPSAENNVALLDANGKLKDSGKSIDSLGGIPVVNTGGTGAAYTATVPGVTSLTPGLTLTIIPHVTSTVSPATLSVNGLEPQIIIRKSSRSTGDTVISNKVNWLEKNCPVQVMYVGYAWVADLTIPYAEDILNQVEIANGGTGATTAAAARANLGAAPAYQYSTTDLVAGTSPLATGTLYFVYE